MITAVPYSSLRNVIDTSVSPVALPVRSSASVEVRETVVVPSEMTMVESTILPVVEGSVACVYVEGITVPLARSWNLVVIPD